MSAIAAVLFDMDGVLVESEALHLRATRAAMGPRGVGFTARDNRLFSRLPDPDAFRVLRILFDLAPSGDELAGAKRRHLVALIRTEGRPLPGCPEIPLRLRGAGIRLGLVSICGRAVIDAVVAQVGLAGAFETIVAGDEVARGAPAPDALLMAARRLGVEATRCLVVDDARDGVLAAKAAGMAAAAVPSSGTVDEDFSPADFVLPSLEALPKALDHTVAEALAGGRAGEGSA
ncbi:MAG TPA: HAD family phosphatase [Methylomirabilota bacterium]|jgi:beta-phosphoglucomutase-like phosphatase (HAD superfamily)|nr:HAD family phosphatase [Methylomirabilota bacterium]